MQAPSNELLNKVKSGDREAFGELYKRCRQPCYAFALLMLKSHEDAEDAVQNTFIRMHGSIRTLKSDEAFITWMEIILNRECLRIANRRGVEISGGDAVNIDRVSDPEEDFMLPEPYAERRDLSQRLKNEIEKLPFEQRRVLLLFYYHGLSLQEIADVTESNLNTVKSRLRYARMSLKENIEQQEKKSGDKFYGVPLLPFKEIIDRILEREKGDKKLSALWRSLQEDIDAVSGGFAGGEPSGSGLHATKIAAGVLAAMLTLGAAAGVLGGAIIPESGHGWSNMQGGKEIRNPKQIPSTEPGTRIEPPLSYPDQNAYTPFDADNTAQNMSDTPQDVSNNNDQSTSVNPTQTIQNSPVSPTQANNRIVNPTQPSPQPTQIAPTQSTSAYHAYRDLLQQNEQAIRSYHWQYSDGSYPVALADIGGDSTPELLFMSANGSTAALSVYTYDGAKTVSLLNGSELRSDVGVDDTYFLFQKSGDKRLYLYSADDNDYGSFRCLRFDKSGSGLTATELCSSKVYPSNFTVGGKAVSSSAYANYEEELFSDISNILMRNDARGMCSDEAYDALGRHASKAMTLDAALKALEEN